MSYDPKKACFVIAQICLVSGCGVDTSADPNISRKARYTLVQHELPGALMSVSGVDSDDIWFSGGDPGDGTGAFVLHYDGENFERFDTGVEADLWWVRAFAPDNVFFGGSDGTILRYDGSKFRAMDTPGDGTVFGIWGAEPDKLWAVGGDPALADPVAFIWRRDGSSWQAMEDLPETQVSSYFKVWGNANDDFRVVGAEGVILQYDGYVFTEVNRLTFDNLLTINTAPNGSYVAVGGLGEPVILEDDGDGWNEADTGDLNQALLGVWLTESGGHAVGSNGLIAVKTKDGWRTEEPDDLFVSEELHGVWTDPDGGTWMVGGDLVAPPLTNGIIVHKGNVKPRGIGEYSE